MAVTRLTAPVAAPVSLDEVKRHLRIETDDEDAYLTDLIAASTDHLETVAGVKLITQSWRQYFDSSPAGNHFRLAIEPVQAITSMRVYDGAGAARDIQTSALSLDMVSSPPRLEVGEPLVPNQSFNGIEIDIVAGYGDAAIDVPDGLRRALLLLIAHAYEFRGAVPVSQQPASEPHGFRTLIAPYKRVRL